MCWHDDPRTPMVLSVFVLFFVFLGPWVSADRVALDYGASAKVENLGIAGRLKAELEKQGLEVRDGCFRLWGIDESPDSFEVIKTCALLLYATWITKKGSTRLQLAGAATLTGGDLERDGSR